MHNNFPYVTDNQIPSCYLQILFITDISPFSPLLPAGSKSAVLFPRQMIKNNILATINIQKDEMKRRRDETIRKKTFFCFGQTFCKVTLGSIYSVTIPTFYFLWSQQINYLNIPSFLCLFHSIGRNHINLFAGRHTFCDR